MLQQTRVAAAIPYYQRFLQRFPNIAALAEAPEPDLLAHWAGLGYYYRVRNMQKAAQFMVANGGFPHTYEGILGLAGVGEYTAAAVASIALNLPHAVVDGNVYRVLSRVFEDGTNIAKSTARVHFSAIAETLLDRQQPGDFNQALMELGATICLPKSPQCLLCPVQPYCGAQRNGTQRHFPVKIKPAKQVTEQRIVFWMERDQHLLLWQRPSDASLMPGFWELPEPEHVPNAMAGEKLGSFRHGITFHDYRFDVYAAVPSAEMDACQWIRLEQLDSIPVSTIVRKARKTISK